MTKVRPPVSFEAALIVIKDLVGFDLMGRAIGRSASTVADYANHDIDTGITLENASKLEKLYRLAGGQGYPISDCMRLRARIAEGFREQEDEGALVDGIVSCIRENNDASSAVARLLLPAASPSELAAARATARRELAESIAADTAVIRLLADPGAVDVYRPPP